MQSRKGSLLESVVNIILGYGVAVTAQMFIFPIFGVNLPPTAHLQMGLFFTGVSLVRSYMLRRLFNKLKL